MIELLGMVDRKPWPFSHSLRVGCHDEGEACEGDQVGEWVLKSPMRMCGMQ